MNSSFLVRRLPRPDVLPPKAGKLSRPVLFKDRFYNPWDIEAAIKSAWDLFRVGGN